MIGPGRLMRWLPLAPALLIVGWAILDWVGAADETRAGFETDASHTVARVEHGSPAEAAGLLPGDRVVDVNGVSASDAPMLPRPDAGETRAYRVVRGGAEDSREIRMTIEFAPLPPRMVARERAATLVGLCFLSFPLLAWYRRPSRASRVLLLMGLGLSLAFIDGPRPDAVGLRAVAGAVTTLQVLAGVAAVVHFLLSFPRPRPWLEHGRWLLYLPALLLWALLAWRLVFRPAATGALNVFTNLAMTAVVGGYLLAALFLVLRNYSRTDRAQRRALALNGMLWGTVLGVLPALLAQLTTAFSPASELPGQDFWFVSLALIPLTWSRSVARDAK